MKRELCTWCGHLTYAGPCPRTINGTTECPCIKHLQEREQQ